MKKDVLEKGLGILVGICCLAMLSGCNTATSSMTDPVKNGIYKTGPTGGPATVPFEAVFRIVGGTEPVNVNTIGVALRKPNAPIWDPWTQIYRYNEDPAKMTNVYGFTIDPDPSTTVPDASTVFTVSGEMPLTTTGQYTIRTHCETSFPNSYFTNGSDSIAFQVASGFETQYYLGGTSTFYVPPDTTGGCFWNFMAGYDILFTTAVGGMIDLDPVNFPGWSDLPQTIDLVTEDLPVPQVAATLTQGTEQIDIDVTTGTVEYTMPEDEWMILDLTANPDPVWGGYFAICGLEFSFDPDLGGILWPTSATKADLELNLINMAWKIAESEGEGEPWGPCTVRRNTLLEIETPFDAMPECGCTAYYSHY